MDPANSNDDLFQMETGGILCWNAARFKPKLLEKLVLFLAGLFAVPLASQGCLYPLLLTGLQVEGVPLDFLDDVLSLDLAFEAAQGVL